MQLHWTRVGVWVIWENGLEYHPDGKRHCGLPLLYLDYSNCENPDATEALNYVEQKLGEHIDPAEFLTAHKMCLQGRTYRKELLGAQ